MASRFRVDHDEEGNAEVSRARPQKLRPIEGQETNAQPSATGQPTTPVVQPALKKSALKGGSSSSGDPEPPPQPAPPSSLKKSAMKGALKGGGDAGAVEPAVKGALKGGGSAAAAAPAVKGALKGGSGSPAKPALKSSMKGGGGEGFTPVPPPGPAPTSQKPKGALKSRSVGPAPEETANIHPELVAQAAASSRARAQVSAEVDDMPSRARMRSRPSVFKMTIEIEDPKAWTTMSLRKHYYHYTWQKHLWNEQVKSASATTARKSIRLTDLSLNVADLASLAERTGHTMGVDIPKKISEVASSDKRLSRKSLVSSVRIDLDEAEEPAKVGDSSFAISPLKEILLMKKPDLKQLGAMLRDRALCEKWINTSLDNTPPPMPSPLFHAAACAQWDVVELLVQERADINAQYQGKSQLKGWIKPNTPLVECVRGRKGRFIGTMLGDKLEAVEMLLSSAVARSEEEKTQLAEKKKPAPNLRGRKSVQLSCTRGLMLHTQGHPNLKYELDANFRFGSSNSVRAAIDRESQQPYAIKAGSKARETSMRDPEFELWNEIVITRKFAHPNIIKLVETFEDENHIFMIFELCQGGELFDRMVNEGSFPERTVWRVAYQMGAALRHLHGLRIAHRDVRPEAFIVADVRALEETTIKMIDFSTAKELISNQPLMTKICTLHYVAPEVLTSSNGYNEKVDVWSFGVVVYMMAAGVPPFDADNELDVLKAVKSGEFSFDPDDTWNAFSQELKDLIKRMMTYNPDERPDVATIMDHARFSEVETEVALTVPAAAAGAAAMLDSTQKMIRSVFSMLGESIDVEHIAELRAMFRDLDEDSTGMVDFSECKDTVLKMLSHNPGADQELVKLLSEDKLGGKVNYAMFLATMTDKRRRIRRETARAIFNTFDIDKNWKISRYEIAQTLSKEQEVDLGKYGTLPHKELQAVWQEMKDVFGGNSAEISDVELSFEDFFKQLPSTNLELV